MNPVVDLATGNFPYAAEIVCFFMAIQGSMAVRNGPNRFKTMNWFHALLRSSLTSYAGAWFTNMFMGRPTKMFSDDCFFGACLVGFAFVNWLPLDIGYHFFNTLPGELLHVTFAQVFRIGGCAAFSDAAYDAFKDTPSDHYPTPIFGPILFPTLLANMAGFFWNGFEGYLEKGMPWLFQNGLFCSTFYHFYSHDTKGYLGIALRSVLRPAAVQIMLLLGADEKQSQDDAFFAKTMVGFWMLTMGIVQMPRFLGPRFSPFTAVGNMVGGMLGGKKKKVDAKPPAGNKKSKKKNQ